MANRTIDQPFTNAELVHFRNKFWTILIAYKLAGNQDRLVYRDIVHIVSLISYTMQYVKEDFEEDPSVYNDVLGANNNFFIEILQRIEIIPL